MLVGLGTIVAGGGAALGTGAFSSVSADRTVNISTEGDGAALLGLDVSGDLAGGTENVIQFDLDADINIDAVTTFSEALTITNNDPSPDTGDPDIGDIDITIQDANENDLLVNSNSIAEGSGMNFVDTDNTLTGNILTLSPEASETFNVVFEFTGVNNPTEDDIPGEITIEAVPSGQ
ncbi:hypothetical protein GCU68_07915 [Natronorubrum aibiense]|uniref:DUF1102 domain-containing protein n=1 Tax=Natronorubrum aibiense TaxID=348826 RepID=A0A5P9P7M4_9EURY|nr:hypothetical protein GCU68_07915 [Natronorubrum aibiense]